jgi:basic membrane protein A
MAYNDDAWRGVEEVAKKYGYEAKALEVGADQSKYGSMILDVAEAGTDYILTATSIMDYAFEYAPRFPDIKFIAFDTTATVEVSDPNIACISYLQNEGSFLAGMAAAGASKTGVIACVGGVNTSPIIHDFIAGYVDGALYQNPDIKVLTAYSSVYGDAAQMKEIATAQANSGADVIFQIGGPGGLGVFQACMEKNIWAVGVDSDQRAVYKESENPELADVIMTSMLKKVGESLIWTFDKIEDGSMKWGEVVILGVAEDSTGIVEGDLYEANVPKEVRDNIEKAKEDIKNGTIKVKTYFEMTHEQFEEFIQDASKP